MEEDKKQKKKKKVSKLKKIILTLLLIIPIIFLIVLISSAPGDEVYLDNTSTLEDARVQVTNEGFSISKWGGESIFDVTLPPQFSVSESNGVVSMEFAQFNAELYMDGSDTFQFDGILTRKPSPQWTEIVLPINLTNIECFLQPPLTEEELMWEEQFGINLNCNETDCVDDLDANYVHKPIENVNSYACYHSTKRNNKYKTGKVFDLRRIKFIDALGDEMYSTQNITSDEWTIYFPNDWLRNAEYPVIIDPEFGFVNTSCSSNTNAGDEDLKVLWALDENVGKYNNVTAWNIWMGMIAPGSLGSVGVRVYTKGATLATSYLVNVSGDIDFTNFGGIELKTITKEVMLIADEKHVVAFQANQSIGTTRVGYDLWTTAYTQVVTDTDMIPPPTLSGAASGGTAKYCTWINTTTTTGSLTLDDGDIQADVRVCDGSSKLKDDCGFQMRWDISSLNTVDCNSVFADLDLYISAVTGSPDNDTNISYISDQTWTEASSLATFIAQPTLNYTIREFPVGFSATNRYNISVSRAVQAACFAGQDYVTIRIEDPDVPLGTLWYAEDNLDLLLGELAGISPNSITFQDREAATASQRPKLHLYYAPGAAATVGSIILDEASSDEDESIQYLQNFTSNYTLSSGTVDSCSIRINSIDFGFQPTGSDCVITINLNNTLPTGNGITVENHTVRYWANDTDSNENFNDTRWVDVTSLGNPNGYWLMRAPVNSSDEGVGDSFARRYAPSGAPVGNGQDIGMMWRRNTTDDEGNLLGDEERHCGIWTNIFFDEYGYKNGTIDEVFCHTWLFNSERLCLSTTYSAQCKSVYPLNNTVVYPNNTGVYGRIDNATKYTLTIFNQSNINYTYTDTDGFNDLNFEPYSSDVSLGVQLLFYPNQKSFCIVNEFNGCLLNDTVCLNATDYDGDGLYDWQEMYETNTDPTDTDTDDDGHDDLQEVQNGKKGYDPYDWGTIKVYNSTMMISATYNTSIGGEPQTPPPEQFQLNKTLETEWSVNAIFNMSEQDGNFSRYLDTDDDVPLKWAYHQSNFVFNITEDRDTINNINVFYGGKSLTATEQNNTVIFEIFNKTGNSGINMNGRKGPTNALFLKQFRDVNYSKIIDEDGNMSMGFWRRTQKTIAAWSFVGYHDLVEVWVVTGTSELNITNPVEEEQLTVTYEDHLLINYTFQEEGVYLTGGVKTINITIENTNGTYNCNLNEQANYLGSNIWQQNCTIPCISNTAENTNITINANSSSLDQIDSNLNALSYDYASTCDTCTYTGSGNWKINLADKCSISTIVDVMGNPVILYGSAVGGGYLAITSSGRIHNVSSREKNVTSSPIIIQYGGSFEYVL